MENKLIKVTDWVLSLKSLEVGDEIKHEMKEVKEFNSMRTRCTRIKKETEKIIKVTADGMFIKIKRIA